MPEIVRDQAEGLRRLLAPNAVRSLTVTAGSDAVGKTSAVINLAAAFVQRGRRVALLDEQSGAGSSASFLGLRPQWDLLHWIEGRKSLTQVTLAGPCGSMLIPASKALAKLSDTVESGQMKLAQGVSEIQVDLMLVDAAGGARPGFTLAAQETVVVMSGEAGAITEAYAFIKECSRDFAKRRFHILVNRVKSARQAEDIFGNMQQATRRFLNVSLSYLGCVPHDEPLRRAVRLRLPVLEAFPAAASAAAFRQIAETIEPWPYPEETCVDDFMQRLIRGSVLPTATLSS